ncbi:hypothetical protein [Paracoccus sp. (in: a-proteobacteria)]|uniref:hypothetical protein n=1 Tax=Paracoccus sp. TaxID=267 RepID=UPI003A8897F1
MLALVRLVPAIILISCAVPLAAADFSDPSWPCIQRKVGALSPGLMWPEPPAPAELAPETRAAVTELAELLTLRRVSPGDAQAAIQDFAHAHGPDRALMAQVFAQTFHEISARRTRIIAGIGEFSLGQITLSDQIDTARARMDSELAKESPDFDLVDRLEEQIDWDQRIFTDRQRTITYLCETPTLLEKQLYAVAQMLQQAAH